MSTIDYVDVTQIDKICNDTVVNLMALNTVLFICLVIVSALYILNHVLHD